MTLLQQYTQQSDSPTLIAARAEALADFRLRMGEVDTLSYPNPDPDMTSLFRELCAQIGVPISTVSSAQVLVRDKGDVQIRFQGRFTSGDRWSQCWIIWPNGILLRSPQPGTPGEGKRRARTWLAEFYRLNRRVYIKVK